MIERNVFIKLHDDRSGDAERAETVERSRALASIPGVKRVTVALPADPGSRAAWDLCLRLEFDSLDAVEAYRVHPDHVGYLAFLEPRTAVRKAWNFTVG